MISRRWFMGLLGGAAVAPIISSTPAAAPSIVARMRALVKAQFPGEFEALSDGLPVTSFRGVNDVLYGRGPIMNTLLEFDALECDLTFDDPPPDLPSVREALA